MRSLRNHTALGQVVNTQDAATAAENGGNGTLEPDDPNGPISSVRRNDDDGDEDEGGGPPPAASTIYFSPEGDMLLTLEDAKDRDLTGRTIVSCMRLDRPDDRTFVRENLRLGHDDVVSRFIGRLPKQK